MSGSASSIAASKSPRLIASLFRLSASIICSSVSAMRGSIVPAVEAGTLKRTPLYGAHVAAGAKLVPFAGWEMPVEYDGIKAEHLRVRSACGVFDVSHMGEIETEGPQAAELLQRLLSNDVSKIAVGGAQYSCLCREDGGVLDDLFSYRLGEERYLTVTNAANHERDLEWFEAHAVEFEDARSGTGSTRTRCWRCRGRRPPDRPAGHRR